MKKFILIIIINSFFLFSFCQSVEKTFQFANAQMELGNYDNAISAFRRILFFDSDNYAPKIYLKLAECYAQTNNYFNAHYYYDLAYHATHSDTLKNQIILKKSFLYIIMHQHNYCLIELTNLNSNIAGKQQNEADIYKGVIFFQKKEYEKSYDFFAKCMNENDPKIKKLDSLFVQVNKLSKKKSKKIYYACIIPGFGHLLAGYPKEAVNSFVLTTGLLVLYAYTFVEYSIIDGIISVAPWFQRYYVGGFENAEKLYKEKIERKQNEIYRQILDLYFI